MKFNILFIIRDHFNTLRDFDLDNKLSKSDIFVFYGIPVVVASVLMFFCDNLYESDNDNLISIFITVFSIFIGLLLNLLVLNIDLKAKFQQSEIKQIVAKQTFVNISYGIVISILGVIFGLCTYLQFWKFPFIFTFLSYFIMVHFILTLFMIIKRVYRLFETL